MAQLQIKTLLGKANFILEKGRHIMGNVMIKSADMENILDAIAEAIPVEINEAEVILKRKEDILKEAQSKSERILQDAQAHADRIIQEACEEQNRIVSESEVLRRVQEEARMHRQEVIDYCENLKSDAIQTSESIRNMAFRDAERMQEGSEAYAEKIFNDLENNIGGMLNTIKQCQIALAEQKARNLAAKQQNSPQQNEQEMQAEYADDTQINTAEEQE